MQKFKSNLQDSMGRARAGAQITVLTLGGEKVDLFSDNFGTPLANPITTSAQGEFEFYAANGRYSLQILAAGYPGESDLDVVLTLDPDDFVRDVINPMITGLSDQVDDVSGRADRALRAPDDEPALGALPDAASRAGKMITFDEQGNPLAMAPAVDSAVGLALSLASSAGPSIIGYQHSLAARLTSVETALRRHFRAEDYYPGIAPVALAPAMCVVRNNGNKSDDFNYFKIIDYSRHAPVGMRNEAGLGKEIETTNTELVFHHKGGANTTVYGHLMPDETIAQSYLRWGGSIGEDKSAFWFYRDIMALIQRSASTGAWGIGVENGVGGVAWDAANTRLVITHDECPNSAVLCNQQGGQDIGEWSIQPTQPDSYTTWLTFKRKIGRTHSARIQGTTGEYALVGDSQNIAIRRYTPASGDLELIALGASVPAVSVSSLTQTGSVATLTTGAAHGLAVGDWVRIAGATETEYNGWVLVATVPSATSVTFAVSGSPSTPATGTITYTANRPGDVFAYSISLTRYATAYSPEVKASDRSTITVNVRNTSDAVVTGAPTASCSFLVTATSRPAIEQPPPGVAVALRWNSRSQLNPKKMTITENPAANFWFQNYGGRV